MLNNGKFIDFDHELVYKYTKSFTKILLRIKLKKITSFDVIDMKFTTEQYFRFLLGVQTGFSIQSTSEKLCMKKTKPEEFRHQGKTL